MDVRNLISSCRTGNLNDVRELIGNKKVDPNVRDQWDGTPLYYACLCGHLNIVNYLLENGAHCDPNTFDGERCHFAALTNDIRRKLNSFKVVQTSQLVSRDTYLEFLRKSLDAGNYSDFTFKVHGKKYSIHKCILSARSPYYSQSFQSRWNDVHFCEITNPNIDSEAFKSVVQFLYTSRLDTTMDNAMECVNLTKQFQIPHLEGRLIRARQQHVSVKGSKSISICAVELQKTLKEDLAVLAKMAVPADLQQPTLLGDIHQSLPNSADVCFIVDERKFHCHKVFFAGRSDYFRCMFRDHFGETRHVEGDIDFFVIQDVSPEVFAQLVHYVYSDSVKVTADTVYDVLNASEMYLMPGLKKVCTEHMTTMITVDNVIDLIRISRTFESTLLETAAIKFVAHHLTEILKLTEFHDLVRDDAAQIKGRQETDSIPLIDDLRYHISTLFLPDTVSQKNEEIEALLQELKLEA